MRISPSDSAPHDAAVIRPLHRNANHARPGGKLMIIETAGQPLLNEDVLTAGHVAYACSHCGVDHGDLVLRPEVVVVIRHDDACPVPGGTDDKPDLRALLTALSARD